MLMKVIMREWTCMHNDSVCCMNCSHGKDLAEPNMLGSRTLRCVVDNVLVLENNIETNDYMWCDGEYFERSSN